MSYERNTETRQALSRQIKDLKGRCIEACNTIENAPPEFQISPEDLPEKSLCYVEGLRTGILNSNTPLTTDDNLLTAQFLSEIKDKTKQVEELVAFTRGNIYDVDAEINRLTNQLKIAQEARSRPRGAKRQVQTEHLLKARDKFKLMKNMLHNLIEALFPDKSDALKEILGQLMSEKLSQTSNGYVEITADNFSLIELLRSFNIITVNPYNKMEVKLAL